MASGAAMAHESSRLILRLGELVEAIWMTWATRGTEVTRLEPLFATNNDLAEFHRHAKEIMPR